MSLMFHPGTNARPGGASARAVSISARFTALACLCLSLLAGCGSAHTFGGAVLTPPEPAPEITLIDQHSRPFTLSAQRGKVVLLFPGYTACPDVCPATLGALKAVHQRLGPAAEEVRFIFLSVDPERDTPAVLRTYLDRIDPAFIGLTGPREQLAATAKAYGLHYGRTVAAPAGVPTLEHTARIFAIDRAGSWRVLYSADVEPAVLENDVRALLAE